MLADHIAVADLNAASSLRLEAQVLWRRSDHSPVSDHVPRADSHCTLDYSV
jgi:hypothetical protein